MISSNFDTSVNYIQIYYKFMLFQSVSSVGIFYHIQRASHPLASSLDKQVSQSVIMLMMKKKGGGNKLTFNFVGEFRLFEELFGAA